MEHQAKTGGSSGVVIADLVNVFLRPEEAEALPLAVDLRYSALADLDREFGDRPFEPVLSAQCRVPLEPPLETVDKARVAIAWC